VVGYDSEVCSLSRQRSPHGMTKPAQVAFQEDAGPEAPVNCCQHADFVAVKSCEGGRDQSEITETVEIGRQLCGVGQPDMLGGLGSRPQRLEVVKLGLVKGTPYREGDRPSSNQGCDEPDDQSPPPF
jgi:hypothetical protein